VPCSFLDLPLRLRRYFWRPANCNAGYLSRSGQIEFPHNIVNVGTGEPPRVLGGRESPLDEPGIGPHHASRLPIFGHNARRDVPALVKPTNTLQVGSDFNKLRRPGLEQRHQQGTNNESKCPNSAFGGFHIETV
jgi:hypothetical protein